MVSAAAVTLLYLSFVMPLSYRFGAAKARSWVSITIFVVFFGPVAFLALMKDNENNPGIQALHALDHMVENAMLTEQQFVFLVLAVLLGITLVCFLLSWGISIRIYAKKSY